MSEAAKHTPADWLRGYAHDLMEDGNLDQEAARLEWAADAFETQERLIESLTKALEAITAEPYGCVFCDSGKLRNPAKSHEEDCAFVLADTALAATMPRRCDTNQVGGMGECLACDAEQGVYCRAPIRKQD